ncbi:MAG: hypothetical protein QOE44_1343, partial [Solirubrobacteraceae bacterium]|nr:hypothetical protein [Solirubrobacteraceae bacterium]
MGAAGQVGRPGIRDTTRRATALALGPTAELGLAGVAAAVLGLVVFAPYVRAGGYHLDDWSNGAVFHFQGADGLF